MHYTQAVVCTLYQYQHSSHDPYLWQGYKCHQKGILGTCGGVLRNQKVSLGLSGGLGEEYSPIGENWDHDGVEMEFRGRSREEGKQK